MTWRMDVSIPLVNLQMTSSWVAEQTPENGYKVKMTLINWKYGLN